MAERHSVWVLRTEPGSSSLQTGLLDICLSLGERARWVLVSSLASNGQYILQNLLQFKAAVGV